MYVSDREAMQNPSTLGYEPTNDLGARHRIRVLF